MMSMRRIFQLALFMTIMISLPQFLSAQETGKGVKKEEMHIRYRVAKAHIANG